MNIQKQLITLLAMASVLGTTLQAADIDVPRIIDASTTWTADNTYYLSGYTFVVTPQGAAAKTLLTIEPGTVIKGRFEKENGEAAALVVTRGAMIHASGTATHPIIFTSELDDLNGNLTKEDVNLWGGLVVLGYAGINSRADNEVVSAPVVDQIEGFSVATNEVEWVSFGGTDDDDNSGVIRFVSIRHGGAVLGTANEINGLTLGGVGRGTTIEYVEVYANKDDSIEWFGGTANARYLISAFGNDDGIDFDQGYRGKIQFAFVIGADIGGDRMDKGGEWDGSTQPLNAQPYGAVQMANLTMVGIGNSLKPDGTPAGTNVALNIRDGVKISVWNSLFVDFAKMFDLENDLTGVVGSGHYSYPADYDFRSNLFWSHIADNNTVDGLNNRPTGTNNPAYFFNTTELNNRIVNPMLAGIGRDPATGALDPRPIAGSPAVDGSVPVAQVPNDGFFTQTDYIGAFDGENNWMAGWTKLSQDGYINAQPGWVKDRALGWVYTWTGGVTPTQWLYSLDLGKFIYFGAEVGNFSVAYIHK
jgi:hypothetical protein